MAAPISCSTECDSYIFPGAIWSLDPEPSPGDEIITIYHAPAVQMDFMEGLHIGDEFDLSGPDCTLYGENVNLVGIIFCLAKSKVLNRWIRAGE